MVRLKMCICPVFIDNAKLFSRVTIPIYVDIQKFSIPFLKNSFIKAQLTYNKMHSKMHMDKF